MGTMTFMLPAGLSPSAMRELERVCVAGGPDSMPWPTQVRIQSNQLQLRRDVNESGCVVAPWEIGGRGCLMGSTATLMERENPYRLEVELARGKVNQLRSQAWDWRAGGLQIAPALDEMIRQCGFSFAEALVQGQTDAAGKQAQVALEQGYKAAEQLVLSYTDQVFHLRKQRQPRLETLFGSRLAPEPLDDHLASAVLETGNSIVLPMTWSAIEPTEGSFEWEATDMLLAWAESKNLSVTAGPLVDFASSRLPDWLWLWERDLGGLTKFMENFVTNAVHRYRRRIRAWQLTTASNCANILSLGEDELLWLTVRLVEVARQIDPEIKPIIGVSLPWGEYMGQEDRTHSPFVFADTLIRSGLNLAAVDVELVMGVTPRGSYCRDLLDISRLLDLYAILGVPLRVTIGFPSSAGADANADPEQRVGGGRWRQDFDAEGQATWLSQVMSLVCCKPYVQAVHWVQLTDSVPHMFPHCGLFDGHGKPKPAVAKLKQLRDKHFS